MRAVPAVSAAASSSGHRFALNRANALFLVALVVVLCALALRGSGWWRGDHGDLLDFVEGGRSVLIGRDIYADIAGVLPFNYPPFGAVVMVPLALLGLPLAFPVLTALSLLSYAVIVVVISRSAGLTPRVATLIGLGGLALEPVFRTVVLGQVNLCLAALVVVDLFFLPRRFRGLLIGVAAGVKLTPALFGLLFLFRREWASAARCAGAFGLTVALGWILAPASSPQYWLQFEWLQRFVEDAMVTQNQSLRAFIMRATGSAAPELLVTAVTVLVFLAGLLAVWRQSRAGADLAAVVGLAAVGLVVAPISWTHHWVWVVPGLILLAAAGKWVAVWGVGMVFFVAPMWFIAGGGRGSAPLATPELIVASAYLWVGLTAIVYLFVAPPLVLPSSPSRAAGDGAASLTEPPRQRA